MVESIVVSQLSNCFDLTVSSIEIDRFHIAAMKGDVSTGEEALRAGVPVDIVVDGLDRTALMVAALYSRTNVIRLLLQNGADVNRQDGWDNTAVHWATKQNNPEVVAMFVENGASIHIRNNQGYQPIDLARQNNSVVAVRILQQLY